MARAKRERLRPKRLKLSIQTQKILNESRCRRSLEQRPSNQSRVIGRRTVQSCRVDTSAEEQPKDGAPESDAHTQNEQESRSERPARFARASIVVALCDDFLLRSIACCARRCGHIDRFVGRGRWMAPRRHRAPDIFLRQFERQGSISEIAAHGRTWISNGHTRRKNPMPVQI